MRTASFLLVVIVTFGLAREVEAQINPADIEEMAVKHDYSFSLGKQKFGLADGVALFSDGRTGTWSRAFLGSAGTAEIPCSAAQGLVGLCLILALMIIVSSVLMVRWKRKREQ